MCCIWKKLLGWLYSPIIQLITELNMNFLEFKEAMNERFETLFTKIEAEGQQISAAIGELEEEIAELRELLQAGQGTPEQYLAILGNMDTAIQAVKDIYEPAADDDDQDDDDDDQDDN
jgi:DNA-binding protein H-NS